LTPNLPDDTPAPPDAGQTPRASAGPLASRLAELDAWMASNPWHPRIAPFAVYILLLLPIQLTADPAPWLYPLLYGLQCGLVVALLWRYRRLTPELNVRFHWLAVPTGLGLLVAWVALGELTLTLLPGLRGPDEPHTLQGLIESSPALGWTSMIMRLLGMSIVVALFEEMFVRSAVLRGMQRARPTGIGITQLLLDMPLIGDALMNTRLGRRALDAPPMLTRQLRQTPVGAISLFGVTASTFIFMINHVPRDFLGCIACGVVWCLLLWWTNRGALPGGTGPRLGLGPIVWSHGITNAALWAYTLYSGDWKYL